MRFILAASLVLAWAQPAAVEEWMQHAFHSVLLGVLVLASLGVPIPEDVPLIAAGVLLKTHPGIATWPSTLIVALIGVMVGDLVLYSLGRSWGPEVVSHRLVRRLITPQRYQRATERFHRHGVWFCFFGRFVVGVRAAMCLTAGATRFPYWRFLLADLAGAVLSVPAFVYLGYWFAGMIPTLRVYVAGAESLLALGVAVGMAAVIWLRYRRRGRRPGSRSAEGQAHTQAAVSREVSAGVPASAPAGKARSGECVRGSPGNRQPVKAEG